MKLIEKLREVNVGMTRYDDESIDLIYPGGNVSHYCVHEDGYYITIDEPTNNIYVNSLHFLKQNIVLSFYISKDKQVMLK